MRRRKPPAAAAAAAASRPSFSPPSRFFTPFPLPPKHARTHTRARAAKTFAEIEAEKDARTPDQAEWLRRAETKIPIGQAPSAESSKAREALAGGGGGGGAK